MTTYWQAPEVAEIAAKLIEEHHPELAGERIEYVYRAPAAKKNGKLRLGTARKISGLAAYLADASGQGSAFFVLEIAGEEWESLSQRKREAVVDHELCHMVLVDGAPTIVGHDLEEFLAVVERHGIWRRELDQFAMAAQMAIPFEGGEDG